MTSWHTIIGESADNGICKYSRLLRPTTFSSASRPRRRRKRRHRRGRRQHTEFVVGLAREAQCLNKTSYPAAPSQPKAERHCDTKEEAHGGRTEEVMRCECRQGAYCLPAKKMRQKQDRASKLVDWHGAGHCARLGAHSQSQEGAARLACGAEAAQTRRQARQQRKRAEMRCGAGTRRGAANKKGDLSRPFSPVMRQEYLKL